MSIKNIIYIKSKDQIGHYGILCYYGGHGVSYNSFGDKFIGERATHKESTNFDYFPIDNKIFMKVKKNKK